ncbi:aryl-sulfate sulfotransferase [bacterium]|nr:aryl-sulfate sulfotransferase [bacterium]
MRRYLILLVLGICSIIPLARAESNTDLYSHIYPKPGTQVAHPHTSIGLRFGENLKLPFYPEKVEFNVVGSISGDVQGKVKIALDNKTVIFTPDQPFQFKEEVAVHFSPHLQTKSGISLPQAEFSFFTGSKVLTEEEILEISAYDLEKTFGNTFPRTKEEWKNAGGVGALRKPLPELDEIELPPSLFTYTLLTNDNPAPGNFVFAPNIPYQPNIVSCNLIMSNAGEVLFYHVPYESRMTFMFEPHPDLGIFSWFQFPERAYYLMDLNYETYDTVTVENGYITDQHELLLLEDGSIMLLGQQVVPVDMSELVDGGNPDALVVAGLIQKLDAERNVLFEWHSLDHFSILDTDDNYIDLTGPWIDFLHMNAIKVDNDDNFLISSRHFSEVTKINSETGEIMWRMGGGNGNQYEFTNDPGFYQQHDVHRLDNGRVMIFDNGGFHFPPATSVKEYLLDETNLTATLMWQYEPEGAVWSSFQGGANRLENGNTVMAWGTIAAGSRMVSEVDPEGNETWGVWFDNISVNVYRAFKTEMLGEALRPLLYGEAETDEIMLYFNQFGSENIATYRIYISINNGEYTLVDETESTDYLVSGLEHGQRYRFKASSVSTEGEESRLSEHIFYQPDLETVTEIALETAVEFQILDTYPNPFNSSISITFHSNRQNVNFEIYDLLGRLVLSKNMKSSRTQAHTITLSTRELSSGVYFLRGTARGRVVDMKKIVLLK